MSTSHIAHIAWPDDCPENAEVSIHPIGPLRNTAEGVMRTSAEHGHIVMSGSRTFMLNAAQTETRLEYVALVEIDPDISMLWHHHFVLAQEPWPIS